MTTNTYGRRGRCLACVIALCSASVAVSAPPPGRIDPDDPPKGLFADDWYAVTLRGRKCGYMHSTMTRKADSTLGHDVIETLTKMELTLTRAGHSITIGTIEQSVETLDGRPLRFSTETDMSLLSMKIRGEVHGNRVVVSTTQFGKTMEQTHPLPAGAMMAWGSYRETVKHPLKPGSRFTLLTYAPALSPSDAIPTVCEIGEREPVDLYGRVVEAFKTRQKMTAKTIVGEVNVDSIVWMDEHYRPLKLEMEMMDQQIVAIQCPKAIATQPADPPELMAETLIPATLPAGGADAKSITYRLTRRGGTTTAPAEKLSGMPTTAMQKVSEADGALFVTVTRGSAIPPGASGAAATEEELETMRAASPFADAKDPEIQKLAKRAADGEKDPHKLVPRLRAFVSEFVETKDLSIGFATASEVARSRQGDCSEHAVLLAALARACGLPARGVSGVVYAPAFAGHEGVFVWHMWTQVYFDGRWHDSDAALEQDDVDATHIAFGLIGLTDAGLVELALPVWNLIGRLQIHVLDIQR